MPQTAFIRRRLGLVAMAALLVMALGLVACGDDDGGEINQDLVDAMVSEGATEEEARCFIEEVGSDAERIFLASDDELSEDDLEKVLDAVEACDLS